MLSKEEVEALQAQVEDEYKYLFKWVEGIDYMDFLNEDKSISITKLQHADKIIKELSLEYDYKFENFGLDFVMGILSHPWFRLTY